MGFDKSPKSPWGIPKIPILLLNGQTNSSIWSKKTQIGIIWFIRDILHNFAATQRECVPAPRAGGPYSK